MKQINEEKKEQFNELKMTNALLLLLLFCLQMDPFLDYPSSIVGLFS